MIIDTLDNAKAYSCIHPLFAKAFEFISKNDPASMDAGSFDIDGEQLKGILICKPLMSREASLANFECHNRYIDIQVCLSGKEEMGWKPRKDCYQPNGGYDEEKDVQFFHDPPGMFFELSAGQFVIFFPGDVHAPMIGEGEIKKLVIKVKI
ncbi:MAG TPA: YhcH/YjgK/YiaL family protein [Flavisolibacter sp.]